LFWRRYSPPSYYSAGPLTSYVGSQRCPSFAPDGERVAFSWEGEHQDNFDVYVKQIGVESPLRLTTDPRPDLSPAWSPDGRTIAFLRLVSDSTAEVLLISALAGGAERRVAEIVAPDPVYQDLRLLAWSPDGKWLALSEAQSTYGDSGLFLFSLETGIKRRLTLPPAGYDDFDAAFSPDGTRLLFVRHSGNAASDVYLLEFTRELQPRGEPRRLTYDHRRTSGPVWTRDGRHLFLTRYGLPGRHSLWKISLTNPIRLEPLPIPEDHAFALALSAGGDRLIYTRETENTNIWAVDVAVSPPTKNTTSAPRPWMTSSREDVSPSFSPDGQQVAFQSSRSGWSEIWMADRDGSHVRQMTELRGSVAGFPHWSPDGKLIVFHSRQHSYGQLFLLDVLTGRPRPLVYQAVNEMIPTWSHDEKWIYFDSSRSGAQQIWKVRTDGAGGITQLTKHGGAGLPLESVDGKFLFYTKTSGTGLWRMPLSGGEEQLFLPDPVGGSGLDYAVARSGIYFIREAGSKAKQRLIFFRFADGQMTTIAEMTRPVFMGLAISPDERTILYSQIDHVSSELMLVENFR